MNLRELMILKTVSLVDGPMPYDYFTKPTRIGRSCIMLSSVHMTVWSRTIFIPLINIWNYRVGCQGHSAILWLGLLHYPFGSMLPCTARPYQRKTDICSVPFSCLKQHIVCVHTLWKRDVWIGFGWPLSCSVPCTKDINFCNLWSPAVGKKKGRIVCEYIHKSLKIKAKAGGLPSNWDMQQQKRNHVPQLPRVSRWLGN